MPPAITTLQRAFQLAQSGQFKTLSALAEALRREGYRDCAAQTSGPYVQAQLQRAMRKAGDAP